MIKSYAEFFLKTYSHFDGDFKSLKVFGDLCGDGPILDLGAGFGRTVSAFPKRELILLESSDCMLGLLNERAGGESRMRIISGSSLKIPLMEETVSGAFSAFGSISEMQPDYFTLQEVHRVLKDEGLFYFLIPNPAAYRTGSLGIRRSSGKEESFSVETFPISALGPHEYMTVVQLKRAGGESFCVFQCYPPIKYWKDNLEKCGFTLEYSFGNFNCDPFIETESPLFIAIAKKQKKKDSAKTGDEQAISLMSIYDGFAERYDDIAESGKYGAPSWLEEKLKPYKGTRPNILDLGCANGFIGKIIRSSGVVPLAMFGFDISSKMVSECNKSGIYDGVAEVDLSKTIPIAKSSFFDLITSFGVLEFINDQAKVLMEIRRLLSIGGEALVSFEALEQESKSEFEIETITAFGSILNRKKVSKKYIEKISLIAGLEVSEITYKQGYTSPSSGKQVFYYYVHLLKRGS